ncbi:MAG: hypothetical protein IJZ02_05880 [Clostridia bacterium]|nr:hypothetical protein [Clostridia bacterium]
MEKLKQKLMQFMYGRYGNDQLGNALLILYLVLAVLHLLTRWHILSVFLLADAVWMLFRCFSRNIPARRRENEAFLRIWRKITGFFTLTYNRLRDCRTHVYHKCPHCRATLRLPRRRGEHTVRCPRCGDSFSMKVHFGKE